MSAEKVAREIVDIVLANGPEAYKPRSAYEASAAAHATLIAAHAAAETEQHAKAEKAALRRSNQLRKELDASKAEAALLRAGILAVEGLIDESKGVYGLHLNGDESPWESLRTDGQFCDWLYDFDRALEALAKKIADDPYVRCKCGGILEAEKVIRFGCKARCRSCDATPTFADYPSMNECPDCTALLRGDPDDACPCGEVVAGG